MLTVLDNDMIHPSTVKATVGQPAKLKCLGKKDFKWYFNDPRLNPIISVNEVITFKHLEVKHSGSYYCYGKYFDREGYFVAKSTVTVQDYLGEL